MTIPDPPWKKKTRPCPFYSQGRCLFSDSCNFLHDVKVKSALESRASKFISHETSISPSPDATLGHSALTAPLLPTFSIQSPHSNSSSPRSTRMSSLLLALQDVIGPAESHTSQPSPPHDYRPGEVEWSSPTYSDVFHAGNGVRQDTASRHRWNELGQDETSLPPSPSNSGHVPEQDDEEMTARQNPIRHRDQMGPETGEQEIELPTQEVFHSSKHSFDLLSPVDLSCGPPIPFPPYQYDGSSHREDSIDSGYADSWVGPSPFVLSPPRPYRPTSTLDLLASPFGSPSVRVLSPNLAAFAPTSPVPSPTLAPNPARSDSIDDVSPAPFTLDSPVDVGNVEIPPPKRLSALVSLPESHELSLGAGTAPDRDVFPPILESAYTSPQASPAHPQSKPVANEMADPDMIGSQGEEGSWDDIDASFNSEDPRHERLSFPLPPPGLPSSIDPPLEVCASSPIDAKRSQSAENPLAAQPSSTSPSLEVAASISAGVESSQPVENPPLSPRSSLRAALKEYMIAHSAPASEIVDATAVEEALTIAPSVTSTSTRRRAVSTVSDLTVKAARSDSDTTPEYHRHLDPNSPVVALTNWRDYAQEATQGTHVQPPDSQLQSVVSSPMSNDDIFQSMYDAYTSSPEEPDAGLSQIALDSPTLRTGEVKVASPSRSHDSGSNSPMQGRLRLSIQHTLRSPASSPALSDFREPRSHISSASLSPREVLAKQMSPSSPATRTEISASSSSPVHVSSRSSRQSRSSIRSFASSSVLFDSHRSSQRAGNSAYDAQTPSPRDIAVNRLSWTSHISLDSPTATMSEQVALSSPLVRESPRFSVKPQPRSPTGAVPPPVRNDFCRSSPQTRSSLYGAETSSPQEVTVNRPPRASHISLDSPTAPISELASFVSSSPSSRSPAQSYSRSLASSPALPDLHSLNRSSRSSLQDAYHVSQQLEMLKRTTLSSATARRSEHFDSHHSSLGAGSSLYDAHTLSPNEAVAKRMSWASHISLDSPAARVGEFGTSHSSSLSIEIRSRSPIQYNSHPFLSSPALSNLRSPISHTFNPLSESPLSASPSDRMPFASPREAVFTQPPVQSTVKSARASPSASPVFLHHARETMDVPALSQRKGKEKADHDVRSSSRSSVQSTGTGAGETKWNRVSRGGKVPFGFRRSFQGRAINTQARPTERTRPNILTNTYTSPSGTDSRSPLTGQHYSPEDSLPSSGGIRPLRLSRILTSSPLHSAPLPSSLRSSFTSSVGHHSQASISSHSVSSRQSISQNPLLSSVHSSTIPGRIRDTLISTHSDSPLPLASNRSSLHRSFIQIESQSAPISHTQSWRKSVISDRSSSDGHSQAYTHDRFSRTDSRLSEPVMGAHGGGDVDDYRDLDDDVYDHTIRNFIPPQSAIPHTAPTSRSSSVLGSSVHAIATPRPTLMFAIASDDVEEVRRVLESGEAGPNDQLGPQSALAFTLTNDRLMHKMEIVKELLAYGANPASLHNPEMNPPHSASIFASGSDHGREAGAWPLVVTPPPTTTMDGMDPATRYYISRADAPATRKTSALIHRSIFRPLTRVRYDIVGQDRVFEQLFMHLNEHSRRFSLSPIVILFCGPSGHGKSLLAHKFGSLLGIPTHSINMTSLRSTHDLWQSQSYQDMSPQTLAEFLLENEGKRCVVVLDEIEKVQDPKVHYSLLPAFEGRYFLHGPNRLVDMRNVVWLGTSNLGDQYVFEYQSTLSNPTAAMSREEYLDLIGLMRTKVTDQLGGGLIGRCTAVLPFVPFSEEEKIVIATEALLMHQADAELAEGLSAATLENAARKSLARYIPAEGARSLHRTVSAMLLDLF